MAGNLKAAPVQQSVSSTFLVKPVLAIVDRGGELVIPIEVVPAFGQDIHIKISIPPKFGILTDEGRHSSSVLLFRYKNLPLPKSSSDSFQFRVQAPGHAWTTYTAQIQISDPPGTITMTPSSMDFGKVPIGAASQQTLLLSNNFGASVSGTLVVTAPWTIVEDPSFHLDEGRSCSFTISFTPTGSASCTGLLKTAPEVPNFPVLPLKGTGTPPFQIDSLSATITTEDPLARFQVTNVSVLPIHLSWSGDESLDFSPPLTLAPGEIGKMWISAARLSLPTEAKKTIHPLLMEDHFSQPLELIVTGAKGVVTLEKTDTNKVVSLQVGHQMMLEATLLNTSLSNRVVSLSLFNFPGEKTSPLQKLTINSEQKLPISIPWTPKAEGLATPTLVISEEGNPLSCISWNVIVSGEKHSSSPHQGFAQPIKGMGETLPTSPPEATIHEASDREKQMILAPLPPSFGDGLIARSIILRWRYMGADQTGFLIHVLEKYNQLSDRDSDHSDHWKLISSADRVRRIGPDTWEVVLPMPWPGVQKYLITPDLPGDKITAPIEIGISWEMFYWPAIRLTLGITLLLLLIHLIRHRL